MGETRIGVREVLLGLGVVLLVVGIGLNLRGRYKEEEVVVIEEEEEVKEMGGELVVEIVGGVMWPGVYMMESGDRVIDLLVECGGLSKDADREWVEMNVNRARKLRDGEKVYIVRQGEEEKEVLGDTIYNNGEIESGGGMINLNTASGKELEELVGIGPSLAGRIVEYREVNSEFRDINELKLVKGIGDKVFEKIKDEIEI